MSTQTIAVPCVLMRAGTSRGPFFLRSDLPEDTGLRDEVLLSAMGAGHELQIDGIGGGNPLTSKVAIVSPSNRPDAELDYLFVQVTVKERRVDTSPNCGNMLSGVAPFAIDRGLVPARDGLTPVRIYNVNTGKLVDAVVSTPGARVSFEGNYTIDGVSEPAAPVQLTFLDAAGAKTGKLLPTGRAIDMIDGVAVTCIDAAMPLVIARAVDLGKQGTESAHELDSDRAFLERLNTLRVRAGALMGLGDVRELVIPKPVIVAPARRDGDLTARYFMPHATHKAFAVTGAVGLATACATSGTIPNQSLGGMGTKDSIVIEHPTGRMELSVSVDTASGLPVASLLRTVRKIFEGNIFARVSGPVPACCA
jgi:2-methylaconitate cis-trans-isomerase PrpF